MFDLPPLRHISTLRDAAVRDEIGEGRQSHPKRSLGCVPVRSQRVRGPLRCILGFRKREIQGRALIYRPLGPHLPTMPMNDPLSRSQSDPSAFELFGAMQALKNPEELIYILHIKACPIVSYEYLYLIFLFRGAAYLYFGGCSHPRELNRIGNQIHKDDFQHGSVAVTHWKRPDFPSDVATVRLLPELRDDLLDKLLQVHCGLFGFG